MSSAPLPPSESLTIPEFYAGRSIFITGCTGFLGKMLIEKILRSCPDVKEIFVLMRPKKNKSIEERIQNMINLPLFDKVSKERPKFAEKIIPVQGDVATEGLGLQPIERLLLIERVSIVFNVAANVKFDDPLKHAIFANTRSARDICILAQNMKNLVASAFMHISSTYAHAEKPIVDELLYPSQYDWKKMIKIAENVDESVLCAVTAKCLQSMPNTYTFSKRLAEQVVTDFSKDIPCAIIRPSIVVSCSEDPLPGWIDNFNGPTGMMVGAGKGILRVMLNDPDAAADFIPVDVVIRATLAASRKRGIKTVTQDPEVHVYNCAGHEFERITNATIKNVGFELNDEAPVENVIWAPHLVQINSVVIHYILTLMLHVLPALLIDTILRFSGRKPMLLRLQRKVYVSNITLMYFMVREWTFLSKKFRDLMDNPATPADVQDFGYDYRNFNSDEFLRRSVMGGKLYLLHEDPANSEKAKKHYQRMVLIDKLFKIWLAGFLIWILHVYGFWKTFYATIDYVVHILIPYDM